MYGPRIEGEKVVLRPHQPEDAAEFIRMLAIPEVTRYLGRQEPMSLDGELQWLEAHATNPNTVGWTIEVDGKCVGNVGFDAIDWRNGHAAVGIFIGDPSLWGQSITTEVARLLAEYAFTQLPLRKIKSGYHGATTGGGTDAGATNTLRRRRGATRRLRRLRRWP